MVEGSVIASTVIDVLVVATVITLIFAVFRFRPAPRGAAVLSMAFTVSGLGLIGLLFLIHLVSLQVLPAYIGETLPDRLTEFVHIDAKWIVVAAATPLICTGFVLSSVERQRTTRLLGVSEARYRSVVEDQLDMIMRWKGDGIRTWVNDAYCRAMSLPRDEAIGTSFFPDIKDIEGLKARRDSLSPESPAFTDFREVMFRDGSVGWQEWISRGVFDESGKLFEIQSIGRDITNRVQTERALKDSEARFKGIVENTHDWVWEADMDFRCVYSNRHSQQLLGYASDEITGVSLSRLMHPDSLNSVRSEFPALHAARSGWRNWPLRFIHKNGRIRYLESSADPAFDDDGNIIGYRGINRDRTFETLLVRLSLDLVRGKADDVDQIIGQSLERIGESYDVDRISVWWIKDQLVEFGHGWARESVVTPRAHVLRVQDFPIASEKVLLHAETHKVESASKLPGDSIERAFMDSQGIKSMMVLPLQHEGSIVGIAVCTTVTAQRRWSEESETELRLLLDKVADAQWQADSTLELIRSEKDLAQSEELAHVGSYAFYPTHQSGDFPVGWAARFSLMQCNLLDAGQADASIDLFMNRIHDDDRSRIVGALQALVENGNQFEEAFRLVRPGGRLIHIASRAELERDRSGRIARIVGSCRDITDQVNREAKLRRAVREIGALRNRLEEENVQLREEIRSYTEFEQIIGDSDALRTSLNLAAKAAPSDAAILVLGETGTGKELVARAIHKLSMRSSERLVIVNCTALPANLIESELFGHEKGAFTGATSRRAGRFEIADGGTLFLDEIGDLPLDLQAKLLRVIEDGRYERLGGSTTLRADVRLIAATNRDLSAAAHAGTFRSDLYYRISTVPIELPPLRERREDVPALAHHFVAKHNVRLGKSVRAISIRMLEYLQSQDWPGNVRELENFIERSMISATGDVLTLSEQPFASGPERPVKLSEPVRLRSVERDHIIQVLEEFGWVIDGSKGAAAALGLAPSTLRSKMKRLGVERPS